MTMDEVEALYKLAGYKFDLMPVRGKTVYIRVVTPRDSVFFERVIDEATPEDLHRALMKIIKIESERGVQ